MTESTITRRGSTTKTRFELQFKSSLIRRIAVEDFAIDRCPLNDFLGQHEGIPIQHSKACLLERGENDSNQVVAWMNDWNAR